MTAPLRLLPLAIVVGAITLSLKLGSLWQDSEVALFQPAVAEQDKAAGGQPSAKPDPAEPAAATAAAKPADGGKAGQHPDTFDAAKATDVELEILQQLAERRAALDRRESELALREATLSAVERRIEAKLGDLAAVKKQVEGLLKRHREEHEAELKSLVKIYEGMKPKDAARIFEQLDMGVLLDVVEGMRENKAAPILAKMTPEKAKAVTVALAERRRLPDDKTGKAK